MIQLNIDELCQNCPCFDGISHKTIYGDNKAILHMIDCENRELCNHLRSYLEKKYESDAERKVYHK